MKRTPGLVALVGVLALTPGSAGAQRGRPGMEAAPEEPMAHMMVMMDTMRADMRRMQEQMNGAHRSGPMPERMGRMMTMMGQMQRMMEEHREQMRAQCPLFQGPAPRPGR